MHIHVSVPLQTPLPSRLPHNIEQSSVYYRVGPCWLSILKQQCVHVHPKLPNYPSPPHHSPSPTTISLSSKSVSLFLFGGGDYNFIYFWLCWVFVAAHFSQVAVSSGYSVVVVYRLHSCSSVVVIPGLQSTGSIVVVHWLSCSLACGIFLDQGSNLQLLCWQMDSLPLGHQRNPSFCFLSKFICIISFQIPHIRDVIQYFFPA